MVISKMRQTEIIRVARYPFTKAAAAYIKESGPALSDLVFERAYEVARDRGKQRVREAIEKGKVDEHPMRTEPECITEILSYVMARILVSCISDDFLIMRYSLAEAVLIYERLQAEDREFVLAVANELGFQCYDDGSNTFLEFTRYLHESSGIRASEWKLVNRDIESGQVRLSKRELARLVQEHLTRRSQGELPLPVPPKIIKHFKKDAKELAREAEARRSQFQAKDFGKISITRLPPCMKHILAQVQAGVNPPHTARFALASFLHTVGMTGEEILTTFATTPDFDPDKARYQILHIAGDISGTEYTPPSCETMKTFGNCYSPDSLCNRSWLNHPLKYYRIKGKKRAKPDSKPPKEENKKEDDSEGD